MHLHSRAIKIVALACVAAVWADVAQAADPVQLTIKDHKFTPDSVTVPAGTRLKLEVTNQDQTPAEFESSDLKAEKIIVPGGKISLFIGPLKPGTYAFFDEYHPDLAKGTLTAVEKLAAE